MSILLATCIEHIGLVDRNCPLALLDVCHLDFYFFQGCLYSLHFIFNYLDNLSLWTLATIATTRVSMVFFFSIYSSLSSSYTKVIFFFGLFLDHLLDNKANFSYFLAISIASLRVWGFAFRTSKSNSSGKPKMNHSICMLVGGATDSFPTN